LLVQQGAMVALQHLPAEDALPKLCLKSSSHGDRDIRFLATMVLFSVKTDGATVCIVISATRVNEYYQTRWQALYHLWQNREPSHAYDELVPTLNDENPTLRALAAMSLSRRHESDELAMDSLRIRETLGTALLDHEMDMFTFKEAVERFELLTGTEIMLDPSKDIEYFNFEVKGRAIVDERIRAWLDGRG
jgi:HEAT repeat protein